MSTDIINTLLAKLDAGPDPAVSLVLADALIERGDPRGELIQLQNTLSRDDLAPSTRSEHKAHIEAILAEHMEALAGFQLPGARWDWHLGFVDEVHLPLAGAGTFGVDKSRLVNIFSHPGYRYLQRLHLYPISGGDNRFRNLLEMLISAKLKAPSQLRSLQLGRRSREEAGYQVSPGRISSPEEDDLSNLWAVFPSIERLCIDLGSYTLKLPDSDRLVDFEWVSPFLDESGLEALCQVRWPNIERFHLWTGCNLEIDNEHLLGLLPEREGLQVLPQVIMDERGITHPEHIDPLLERLDALPQLRDLGILNYAGSWGELANRCNSSAFWRRLRSLDLSHGRLPEEHVEAFLAACRAMPQLTVLRAVNFHASEQTWGRLLSALPGIVEGSRADPTDASRYFYINTWE